MNCLKSKEHKKLQKESVSIRNLRTNCPNLSVLSFADFRGIHEGNIIFLILDVEVRGFTPGMAKWRGILLSNSLRTCTWPYPAWLECNNGGVSLLSNSLSKTCTWAYPLRYVICVGHRGHHDFHPRPTSLWGDLKPWLPGHGLQNWLALGIAINSTPTSHSRCQWDWNFGLWYATIAHWTPMLAG